MTARKILALALGTALAGCGAKLPSLTTGSLFGGTPEATAKPAAAPQVRNDPLARAMQVAATSARAEKCGFNFDPVKLRNQFLASEAAASPNEAANLTQVYDTSFRGISKTLVGRGGDEYCTPAKSDAIKTALNRHLSGDYTPEPPPPPSEAADAGILGGVFDSSPDGGRNPNFTKNPYEF